MSRTNGRSAGPPSGLQKGQPNSRPGVSRASASGGMLVDVLGVDVAVRVGGVVAVVDRRPHRPVRCDGEARAVAHARRERLGPAAAGRDPHDRRSRGIGVAIVARRCCPSSRSRSRPHRRVRRRRSSAHARRRRAVRGCAHREALPLSSVDWWLRRWCSRRRRSGRSRRHRASNRRMPSHAVGRDLRAASTLAAPHRVSASTSRSVRWRAAIPAGPRPVSMPPAGLWGSSPTPTSSSRWAPAPAAAASNGD